MSQEFELKFDAWRENDPTANQPSGADSNSYVSASNTRNLGFAWPDGRRMFLNYSYLVAAEYSSEQTTITLIFTTHVVKIRGLRLQTLFAGLMEHLPRIITAIEERYSSLQDGDGPVVLDITVEEKK